MDHGVSVVVLSALSYEKIQQQALEIAQQIEEKPQEEQHSFFEEDLSNENIEKIDSKWRWAVGAHNFLSLVPELRRFPPPVTHFEGIFQVPPHLRLLSFLFSGQGTQLSGSWQELYQHSAVFSSKLREICTEAFEKHQLPLSSFLEIDEQTEKKEPAYKQMDVKYVQPAIFSIQIALITTWNAVGVVPDVVVGHSFGEFAASVLIGALTWQEGLAIVIRRAALMASVPLDGGMIVIFESLHNTERFLETESLDLCIACVNTPSVTVLSGLASEIEKAEESLKKLGIRARRLTTTLAFHSKYMKPIVNSFGEYVELVLGQSKTEPKMEISQSKIPRMISTVTGNWIEAQELRQSHYWKAHCLEAVRFLTAMNFLRSEAPGCTTIVEIGPEMNLLAAAKKCLVGPHSPNVFVSSLCNPNPGSPGTKFPQAVAYIVCSPWGLANIKCLKAALFPRKKKRTHTSSHSLSFRVATLGDIHDLVRLEKLMKPAYRLGEVGIRQRLATWGTHILEIQQCKEEPLTIAGVIYAQRVQRGHECHEYHKVRLFEDLQGDTIQLLHLVVDPLYRCFADNFHRCILETFSQIERITNIYAVTHTVGYDGSLSFQDYIKSHKDRNLYFHLSHGALFEQIIEGYCVDDFENGGYGVGVRYELSDRFIYSEEEPSSHPSPVRRDLIHFSEILIRSCQSILGSKSLSQNEGWFQMGMDSMGIVNLHNILESQLGVKLPITFLFHHPTINKAALALIEVVGCAPSSIHTQPTNTHQLGPSDIAIVGMACKVPGPGSQDIEDLETLWDCIQSPPRLPTLDRIQQPENFDPDLFGLSQSEASAMHPQQRWALEVAKRALDDARLSPSNIVTGVFVGAWESMPYSNDQSVFALSGRSNTILANRISFVFNLTGPSMVIDTACSSSLVALDTAIGAIHKGSCDAALVIGVNYIEDATTNMLKQAGFLSPTGRCHTMDACGDGYHRSEGCVGLVLRRSQLSIDSYATILSSAVNQDGKTANLHAPNPGAQEALLKSAYELAGVDPKEDIHFIELHGTGTRIGDPIEISSIQRVVGSDVWLTCAKPQFGHMEATAGLLGVLRTVLCLQSRFLPPNPFLHQLNPLLPHLKTPKECPVKLLPGPSSIVAGVSSFGFGGTNSHVVLRSKGHAKKYARVAPFSTRKIPWSGGGKRVCGFGRFDPAKNGAILGMLTKEKNGDVVWSCDLGAPIVQYLSGHRVRNVGVLPATCLIELVMSVAENLFGDVACVKLQDLKFTKMFYLEKNSSFSIKVVLKFDQEQKNPLMKKYWVHISLRDGEAEDWSEYSVMSLLKMETDGTEPPVLNRVDFKEIVEKHRASKESGLSIYETFGNAYEGDFLSLQEVWHIGPDESVAKLSFQAKKIAPSFLRACAVLDCALHLGMERISLSKRKAGVIISKIESCTARGLRCLESGWVHWNAINKGFKLYNDFGELVAEMGGVQFRCFEETSQILSIDDWVVCDPPPQLDQMIQKVEFNDIFKLHSFIQERIQKTQTQESLCVVVRNEEQAAYLRSVRAEQPDWDLRSIQMKEEEKKISEFIGVPKKSEEKEWRIGEGGKWEVRRLKWTEPGGLVKGIKMDERGDISNVRVGEAKRVTPTEGTIEIETKVVGLNFRDVLNVLGAYPGDPGPLGGDCAGTVVRVGFGVDEFQVGDQVYGIAFGSLQTYVLGKPAHFQLIPKGISLKQAATLPIVSTTVHQCLVNCARLKKGQRVLIHAGTGGVGLTAIYYAQKIGCEVVATVGSERKREYLRNIGVQEIGSSRDAELFKENTKKLKGQVDVVLNSLSGNFIKYSLELLKEGGHFCEIGKRGIWSLDEIKKVHESVEYHVVAIDEMMERDPKQFSQLFKDTLSFGIVDLPLTEFPIAKIRDALRFLQTSQHIGKVVVTGQQLELNNGGTYLISGGLGYLGQLVAKMLIDHGAKNIVLLSSQQSKLPNKWDREIYPIVEQCDVGDLPSLRRVFNKYKNIQGIVHAAGVLADGTIQKLTKTDFERVYHSKVKGAHNLEICLEGREKVDFFVLFSSVASGIGSVGQANYAAANGCLDDIARRRVRQGEVGLSIRWGPWSGGGMATETTLERLERIGVLPLKPEIGVQMFGRLLYDSPDPVVTISSFQQNKLELDKFPYFKGISNKNTSQTNQESSISKWISNLHHLKENKRGVAILEQIKEIANSIGFSNFNETQTWGELGLDSLSMIEMRNGIFRLVGSGMKLSSTILFDYPTPRSLCQYLQSALFTEGVIQQQMTYHSEIPQKEPLAIIGIGCRLPGGCNNTELFWEFLEQRRDAIGEIPLERMDWRGVYDPFRGKLYTNKGGFTSGATLFDHKRFGISRAEAQLMDPHQRYALETAYEALGEAGIELESEHRRPIGTFVGEVFRESESGSELCSPYYATGVHSSITANRISYLFKFSGPSMTIDTACSSSLVAVDAAHKAICNGDCQTAVIIGVSLMLSLDSYIGFCAANMISHKGRCSTFSDEADGYVRGEGCAAIVVKPLSKALEEGDHIRGVIYGVAVNQDGKTATMTAPNGPAQEEVIQTAIHRAGISPAQIGYVEAHGTGTPLGDPIEAGALANVFKNREDPLIVGAVKSNFGHLEAAAGMTGLVKAVMCIEKGWIPGNLHCENLNPRLKQAMEVCPLVFPREGIRLEKEKYVGISSFGFGGTNAHVVIGASPKRLESELQQIVKPMIKLERISIPWKSDGHPFLGKYNGQVEGKAVWTCQWDSFVVNYFSLCLGKFDASLPFVCFFEMVAPGVEQLYGDVGYTLKEMKFKKMMYLGKMSRPWVRVSFERLRQKKSQKGEEHIVVIQSRACVGSPWIDHCSMRLRILVEGREECGVKIPSLLERFEEGREIKDSFYNSLGNGYAGDFHSLETVWHKEREAVGKITFKNDPKIPGFLRCCALLDVAQHVGIERMDEIQRASGVYIAEVESFTVLGAHRKYLKGGWSHWQYTHDPHKATVTVYDEDGEFIAKLEGVRSESLEGRGLQLVSVDDWVICDPPPQLDQMIQKVEFNDIFKLHSFIQERIQKTQIQESLCVVVRNEEQAAYLRSVRAEQPDWDLRSIQMKEEEKKISEFIGVPKKSEEKEWRIGEGGKWEVRRSKWIRSLLKECKLDSSGTYLLSGGLGYLGQLVAKMLIDHGAKNIVLLSSQQSKLPNKWDREIYPIVEQCDVGDLPSLRRVFNKYKNIQGIVHAAGVLADGTIQKLTKTDFERVYHSKVKGAHNLEICLEGREKVDFFVLFSSVASGIGSVGQANYAAANGCLDDIARRRVRQGEVGLSIRWGPWSGGGMATETTLERLERIGVLPLKPEIGVQMFGRLLYDSPDPVVTISSFQQNKLELDKFPYFKGISNKNTSQTNQESSISKWISNLHHLKENKRGVAILEQIKEIANSIGFSNFNETQTWGELGLDSLSMIEMRNGIFRLVGSGMKLSSTILFDYPTPRSLCQYLQSALFTEGVIQQQMTYHSEIPQKEPLAIIGIGCRLPGGCNNTELFWEFLEQRRDAIGEIPLERMDWRGVYDPFRGKLYTNKGGFTSGATLFDHKRFGISRAEAQLMDPHQRYALETAYEALGEAGIELESEHRRPIGTFVGESVNELLSFNDGRSLSPYVTTGAAPSITANRISYLFKFSGPSMTIDTACSSSLVAVDAAHKAICNGDCQTAVIIGVSLMLSLTTMMGLCAANMISHKGRCSTFSDEADGYVRGEGCAAIVVKPLSKALEEGDHIRGVIYGVAVNQDGKTATMTAPNGPAQEEVIQTAIHRAGISPAQIGYVEAHGTGTPLGDPIEAGALANVFKNREDPLIVGAVKSNFGHLEAAAGMTGLVKAVMCIEKGWIPGNLHCENLNPRLKQAMEVCPLVFPREGIRLEKEKYVGISSFGFGGTNAHVVIGASPKRLESELQQIVKPMIKLERISIPWKSDGHPFLGKYNGQVEGKAVWTCQWDQSIVSYLSDHRVWDIGVLPATCYIEMVAPGVEQLYGDVGYTLKEMKFKKMMYLGKMSRPWVRVSFERLRQKKSQKGEEHIVVIQSHEHEDSPWIEHVTLKILINIFTPPEVIDIHSLIQQCGEGRECKDSFYNSLGNGYAGDFHSLETVWHKEREAVGKITFKNDPKIPGFLRCCALLDVAQHVGIERMDEIQRASGVYIAEAESFTVLGARRKYLKGGWSHWQYTHDPHKATVTVYDEDGEFIAKLEGVRSESLEGRGLQLVSVDDWVICDPPPQLDQMIQKVEFNDIFKLHSFIQERIQKTQIQESLCVVVRNEEQAAYLRSVRAEQPDWDLRSIQMKEEEKKISEFIGVPKKSEEKEWRIGEGGKWEVRRLKWTEPGGLVKGIKMDERGDISNVRVGEAKRVTPTEGTIEIETKVVGLNFRDVLNVLGAYPGDPGPLGGDCAGTVVRVGFGVDEFQVGDQVYGIAFGSLQTYVLGKPAHFQLIPKGISLKQAATLPIVSTTVHQCLVNCARLKKGQRVLIHAGTGGVGLTAIYYAQKIGCEVVATVGSERKREYLRNIGVQEIGSSRDAELFKENTKKLKGQVDVVLNSLSGNFIKYSLELLKEGGHFCEIGKRGIWSLDEIKKVHESVEYHVVAIDEMMERDPKQFSQLFQDTLSFGIVDLPLTEFPIAKIRDALRFLQTSQHIGKVVVTGQQLELNNGGTYLLSGGLGYLGQLVAKMLIDHGAKNIVLLSSQQSKLPNKWDREIYPIVEQCDVGDLPSLRRVFNKYKNIQGIVHAAGVLADGTIQKLTKTDFERVYHSKVKGAHNLEICLEGREKVDFFVLFSSVASGIGSVGQANYAAANGCLDDIARRRVRQGEVGLSIRWGPWSGGGMATETTLERLERIGVLPLKPEIGVQMFGRLLYDSPDPVVTICPFNLHRQISPVFSLVFGATHSSQNPKIRTPFSLDYFKTQVSSVLRISVTDISPHEPLSSYGLDSLSSMELVSAVNLKVGFPLLSMEFLTSGVSIDDVMALFHEQEEVRSRAQGSSSLKCPSGKLRRRSSKRNLAGLLSPTKGTHPQTRDTTPRFSAQLNRRLLERSLRRQVGDSDDLTRICAISVSLPNSNSLHQFWRNILRGEQGYTVKKKEEYDQGALALAEMFYCNMKPSIEKGYQKQNVRKVMNFGLLPSDAAHSESTSSVFCACALKSILQAFEQCRLMATELPDDVVLLVLLPFEFLGSPLPNRIQNLTNELKVILGLKPHPLDETIVPEGYCSSGLFLLSKANELIRSKKATICVACCVNLISVRGLAVSSQSAHTSGEPKPFGINRDGYARVECTATFILTNPFFSKARELPTLGKFKSIVCSDFLIGNHKSSNSSVPQYLHPQTIAMQEALEDAKLTPNDISYVELHGPATIEGDIQEYESFKKVYCNAQKSQDTLVGVSTISPGNTEVGCGFIGILKVLLSLTHDVVPGVINPLKPYQFDPACDISCLPSASIPLYTRPGSFENSSATTPLFGAVHVFGINNFTGHTILQVDGDVRRGWETFDIEGLDCSKMGYSFTPPLPELRKLSLKALTYVPNFSIEFPNGNRVAWTQPVDLRDAGDIAAILSSEGHSILFDDWANEMERGVGLNTPAIVTMRRLVCPREMSRDQYADFLAAQLEKQNAKFLSYQEDKCTCCFQVGYFSKKGYVLRDDEPEK